MRLTPYILTLAVLWAGLNPTPAGAAPQEWGTPQVGQLIRSPGTPSVGGRGNSGYGASYDVSRWGNSCQVRQSDGRGLTNVGSAALIVEGGVEFIFSCWHTFRDNPKAPIRVLFPASGQTVEARLIAADPQADAAVLTITSGKHGVNPGHLSNKTPGPGDFLTLIGFGGNPRKGFLARGATGLTRASSLSGSEPTSLYVTGSTSEGDSGGPVIDKDGLYVGCITATDGYRTLFTCGRAGDGCGLFRGLCAPFGGRSRAPPLQTLPPPGIGVPSPSVPRSPPIDYDRIVASVIAKIKAEGGCVGVQGPPGIQGPAGPKGDQGDPGVCDIDIDAIAAAIAATLPKPKDGKDGKNGKDGRPGRDGKDATGNNDGGSPPEPKYYDIVPRQ